MYESTKGYVLQSRSNQPIGEMGSRGFSWLPIKKSQVKTRILAIPEFWVLPKIFKAQFKCQDVFSFLVSFILLCSREFHTFLSGRNLQSGHLVWYQAQKEEGSSWENPSPAPPHFYGPFDTQDVSSLHWLACRLAVTQAWPLSLAGNSF